MRYSYRHLTVSSYRLADTKTVQVPPFAESISEGDIRWEKAVGDSVAVDEVVAEIETDKTTVPVPSPSAGVITELLIPDGEKVVPHQDIFVLSVGDQAAAATPAATPAAAPAAAPASPAASPVAAVEVPAAAPAAVPSMPAQPLRVLTTSAPVATLERAAAAVTHAHRTGGESRVKMTRMRARIAQRLKDAQNTYAMLTTFNEVDMSGLIALRQKHKDAFFKKHGVKLSFMSPFVAGAAAALKDEPVVNAVIDGNEIVYRDSVDISVAVATPKGLVVPVLRDVDRMDYVDIEMALAGMAKKARDGQLAVEDMDGGSFTISNGGVFGSLMGTPIINPPQSAILGMHGTFERPVARNGEVVIRPMMYVALTYDHRLVDGREAVLFLRRIKAAVEDPTTILMRNFF